MIAIGFAAFVWVWYRLQGLEMPRVHRRIAEWLEARWRGGEKELLLLAFRSAGKSTLVGLFCAWLLALDSNLRILVLAADHALAVKMVRNVRRILERHPATRALKPRRAEEWAAERFTVERPRELRDPSMLARGITANVTGSRADVVICDDVEVPNTSDTADKRRELRERLGEIDFVLVPGGTRLYVGTPHSYFSIYAAEPRAESGESEAFLSGYRRLEIPLVNAGGQSAWPERFPPARIAELKRRSGAARFSAQMQLRPTDLRTSRLNPDRLRLYDGELEYSEGNGEPVLALNGRRLVSASAWWDPAYGAPQRGDASVVAALFTDAEGRYYLHRIAYLTHDPSRLEEEDAARQLCRQVAGFARSFYLPAVTVETNGIGRFLPGLLRLAIAEAGAPTAVIEASSRRAKAERILEAFDVALAAGALHVHRSVWRTPFVVEMREWRPGSGRDDGLDAVAGALLAEPVRLPRAAPLERSRWRSGAGTHWARSDFNP